MASSFPVHPDQWIEVDEPSEFGERSSILCLADFAPLRELFFDTPAGGSVFAFEPLASSS